jgi:CheY-like chemotaxis protein
MTNGINFSILLVDDDAEDRQIIDEAFVEIDNACDIKKFVSGTDLLSYLENVGPELFPSLIVIDYNMPGLSATELLGILKQNEAYKDIPVIIYSSHTTASKQAELQALGAYDFVEKGDTMKAIIEMAKRFTAISKEKTSNTP